MYLIADMCGIFFGGHETPYSKYLVFRFELIYEGIYHSHYFFTLLNPFYLCDYR
jgi:hypothetical protein